MFFAEDTHSIMLMTFTTFWLKNIILILHFPQTVHFILYSRAVKFTKFAACVCDIRWMSVRKFTAREYIFGVGFAITIPIISQHLQFKLSASLASCRLCVHHGTTLPHLLVIFPKNRRRILCNERRIRRVVPISAECAFCNAAVLDVH